MKYQTNAVGHRVGASELPTRHPRHKPRRRFPLLSFVVASYSKISPCSSSLFLSLSLLFLLLSLIPPHVPLFFSSSVPSSSSSTSTSYISSPHLSTSSFFLFFFSLSHRAISTFLFNVFFSLPENNEFENSELHIGDLSHFK